jgi:cystathionine beta-lyase family protein involved in aluminum resistance
MKEDEDDKGESDLDKLNKELSNNLTEDLEQYEAQLMDLETEIRELDPSRRQFYTGFEDESILHANLFKVGSTIEFSVDSTRPIELLFQPYIAGNDQVPSN